MVVLRTFDKTSSDILDFGFDWSSWLASGETVFSSSWIVDTGITQNSASSDSTSTTIWLSGGIAGSTYLISNIVITSASRTVKRSFYVRIVSARGQN